MTSISRNISSSSCERGHKVWAWQPHLPAVVNQKKTKTLKTASKTGNLFKLHIGSLAVQEFHDWLEDVVSILGHAAGISHIRGSLNLSQDVSHLLNIFLNMRLETIGEEREKLLTNTHCRDYVCSVCVRMCAPTWQQRPCWDHPWHCWV